MIVCTPTHEAQQTIDILSIVGAEDVRQQSNVVFSSTEAAKLFYLINLSRSERDCDPNSCLEKSS